MSPALTWHLLRRLLRGRRLLGMVALASVPGLLAWLASSAEPVEIATRRFHEVTATVTAATLSIAVLVLGAATLRDERDTGTLPYIFLTPLGRVSFSVSAWLAAAGASILVALAGWSVALVAALATIGTAEPAVPALAAYLTAALAYSGLFLPLGYLFSRSVLVGLGYVFVWEGILATFVPGLASSSVWRTAMSVYADLSRLPEDALEVLGPVTPGVGGGLAKVAVMVAVGLGALVWALRYRDAV